MDTSTPPSEALEDLSYTKMDEADLDAIGAHCQMEYCHRLDFLPFRCESCKYTFCLDHRSETAHQCKRAGEWARNRRLNSLSKPSTAGLLGPVLPNLAPTQCSQNHCKTMINTVRNVGSRCTDCDRQYCLKHRFREEHDCKAIAHPTSNNNNNNSSSLESQTAKVRASFSRLRTWSKQKSDSLTPKPNPKPNTPASQLLALSNLKKLAKGDPKLSPEQRIYLHVEAEAATTTSKLRKAELYFNAEWSVGRMLDEAAKRLQVANVNNRVETEEQRLRVYHVEGGRLLEFGEKLGVGVASGNTVVLLRGVGPAA